MTLGSSRRLLAQPQDVVGGRYRLLEPIGHGAAGEVWRAQHVNVGNFAAVKLVGLGREDPEMLSRVLTEAQAAAALQSAHVVQVYDQGTEGEVAYIAMELLEGESLAERLARGPMPPIEVARVVRDVARAVGKAHAAGIIHRDLKPQNIFLTLNEGTPIAKVLDFGIAKVLAAQGATREGVVVGTPAYMSPEQVSGTIAVDWRTDLWQLAIIAFECLTGRLPYSATTMGELFVQISANQACQALRPGELSPAFEAWFRHATDPEIGRRFQSARELESELSKAIAPSVAFESPATGGPAPWEVEGADDAWRRKMYGVAVGLACTAILLVAAVGVTLSRPARSEFSEASARSGQPGSATPADAASAEAASADAARGAPTPEVPEVDPVPPPSAAPEPSASATAAAAAATPAASPTGPARPARPVADPWGL